MAIERKWSPEAEARFKQLNSKTWVSRNRSGGLFTQTFQTFRQVFEHRQVLSLLIRRDLQSRYKDSALGMLWVLMKPLVQLGLYFVAIGLFLGANRGIPNFAIYIFCGLTTYSLFSEIVGGGTQSIVANSGLIKKVYLPREVFPLASAGSALINSAFQFLLLFIASLLAGAFNFSPVAFLAIPAILIIFIYALSLAILLSALNVYLRDVQYLIEVFLMIFMWASPVVYSWNMVKEALGPGILLEIYTNNPITLAVLGIQQCFWHSDSTLAGSYPPYLLVRMFVAIVVGVIFFVFSQRIFSKLEGDFAQSL